MKAYTTPKIDIVYIEPVLITQGSGLEPGGDGTVSLENGGEGQPNATADARRRGNPIWD